MTIAIVTEAWSIPNLKKTVVSTKPENPALFVYLKPQILYFCGQSKKTVPSENRPRTHIPHFKNSG